jgi:hypothetical protein
MGATVRAARGARRDQEARELMCCICGVVHVDPAARSARAELLAMRGLEPALVQTEDGTPNSPFTS